MPPTQIEALLGAPDHESRVGAVSITDFQVRRRSTLESRRRELYELYVRRHDLINTWDMVDRAAPYVVGGTSPTNRAIRCMTSPGPPIGGSGARRSWPHTSSFGRATSNDAFVIGDILAHDPEDLVQKAVGGWIREAGKRNPARLIAFLDRHSRTMPRTALRYAIEHLDPELRRHYRDLRREASTPPNKAAGAAG